MLTNLTEDVIFALIRYEGGKVLSHDAVPVWSVVLVKEGLDVFCDVLLLVRIIHYVVHLLDEVSLHLLANLLHDPADVSFRSHLSLLKSNMR